MPAIDVILHGDHERVSRELGTDRYAHIHTTADWTIDVLDKGMQSGASSLMLIVPADITYDDGSGTDRVLLMIETSVNAYLMAGTVIAGHCRSEVERPGWARLNEAARAMLQPRYAEAIRRAIPSATDTEAMQAAGMMLDGLGSGDGL